MAIRNIVKEGDPILNKVCRPVTNFDDRLATLLDDMRETMIAADGVGLAGPQVGMLRRLFVVWDTTDAPEEIPEDYEYKFIDFVNPEILAVSEDEETAYEGCLSFPGHNGAVTRPAAVKVRAQDRNGNWFELEAEDLLAQWESGERTAESFGALAEAHSDDTGSNTNGGLYEAVYDGQMFAGFNDWIFNDEHTQGDTGLIENTQSGQQGWHVIYFQSWNDPKWTISVRNTLLNDQLTAWVNGLTEGLEVVEGSGLSYVG